MLFKIIGGTYSTKSSRKKTFVAAYFMVVGPGCRIAQKYCNSYEDYRAV